MKVEVQGSQAHLFCGEMEKVEKPKIRIWMDGAFDMMHFGHMNAFRQGKALGQTDWSINSAISCCELLQRIRL